MPTFITRYVEVHELGWCSWYSNLLRAGWSGDRILVGLIFSTPIHTGPGAQPASYTMGTGSLLGVQWPQYGVEHPPPSSAEVKEREEL